MPTATYPTECLRIEDAMVREALNMLDARFATGDMLQDPQAAGRYLKLHIGQSEREVFVVAFLNARHQLIAIEPLFQGTLDGAEVHPREVVKAALRHNAAAVLLAHNHPSGNPEPSAADRAVTARLKQALALVDVRVLDHFVIGRGEPVSLAAKGWV